MISSKMCVFFVQDVLHCQIKAEDGRWVEGARPLAIAAHQGALVRFRGHPHGKKHNVSFKARKKAATGRWYWDLRVVQVSSLLQLLCVPNWTRPAQSAQDRLSSEAHERIGIPAGADGIIILGVRAESFSLETFANPPSAEQANSLVQGEPNA